MRYFKAINKNGEFQLFETMGRAGNFKIETEPIFEVDGVISNVSEYCGGKKKIIIEFTIDE